MTTIAIVPARGGSKGIPLKNLRPVGGIPLVGRTVAAARGARLVDDVYVSTDDEAIAQVAMSFGAKIIRRPDHLATDAASSEAALQHAVQVLENDGILPTRLVMLQCTSPFTTSSDIDRVIEALQDSHALSALAVIPDHGFLWRIERNGFACGVNHDHTRDRKRRQDLEPQYRETGAIYVMNVAAFKATGNRFCGDTLAVPIDAPPLEIDEEADLIVADALAAVQATRVRGEVLPTVGDVAKRFHAARAPRS